MDASKKTSPRPIATITRRRNPHPADEAGIVDAVIGLLLALENFKTHKTGD